MYLHIGTYSGHLITLQGVIDNLSPLHNFQAIQGSIKSLARSQRYLLAAGYDQLLHIYDILTNTQQGQINCQQGVINKIRIVGNMVLTGGQDGSILVWKLNTWDRVHKSKQHKSIETMDIHPSGKLMITTGKQRKLIFWNLLKFIRVLDIKLKFDVKKVLFFQDDIIIISENGIHILDKQNNTTIEKAQIKSKIQDALIYKNSIITSHEKGEVIFWCLETFKNEHEISVSKIRVKCLSLIQLEGNDLLVSADSDGQIKFWHLPTLIGNKYTTLQQCLLVHKKFNQRILCIESGLQFEDEEVQQNRQQNQQNVQQEQQHDQEQEQPKQKVKSNKKKIQKIKQQEIQKNNKAFNKNKKQKNK